MLFQALDVEIEVKNLNLQVTLLGQKVWEWRSHQAGNQGGAKPPCKIFRSPTKTCWTYFGNIGHSLKTLHHEKQF